MLQLNSRTFRQIRPVTARLTQRMAMDSRSGITKRRAVTGCIGAGPSMRRIFARDTFPAMDVTIVGAGRLGTALAKALKAKGIALTGPLHRSDSIRGKIVLLAVPDREITNVAKLVPKESIIGHTAG